MDPGLKLVIAWAGNSYRLSKKLGISSQALSKWWRIPAHQILPLEKLTGIPRERLRPDLYRQPVDQPEPRQAYCSRDGV